MIQLISINHKQFNLLEREAHFGELRLTPDTPHIYLETCNRQELYSGEGQADIRTIRHLFRVTAGLESALLGETAIQAQVKGAYQKAITSRTISKGLHHLFQAALKAGKRVRTETGLSKGAMSHSLAAMEIIKMHRPDIQKAAITILGVNKLNTEIITYLLKNNARTIFITSRTHEKAANLGTSLGCQSFPFSQLTAQLPKTDILICATSAPYLLIQPADFPPGKEMFILDLAMPRNVAAPIGFLPDVCLLNLEEIEATINRNRQFRIEEVELAEQIIEEEVCSFMAKFNPTRITHLAGLEVPLQGRLV